MATTDMAQLVAAVGALPGISITRHDRRDNHWTVHCLMDVSASGERSLSIVAFTVDRHVHEARIEVGGQHNDHPGRACFTLSGPDTETARSVASWIDFGHEALRERESRN